MPANGTGGIIGKLLDFLMSINTWTRALIALLLGFATLAGWIVYNDYHRIIELVEVQLRHYPENQPYMTPLTTNAQRVATRLQQQLEPTGLIILTVWRVDLVSNQITLFVFDVADGFEESFQGALKQDWKYPQPLFGLDTIRNHIVAKLYIGQFHCEQKLPDWGPFRRAPNLTEICFVGVPAEGIGLAGFIMGGWKTEVPWNALTDIESAFRAAADELTWRRLEKGHQ